MADKNEQLQMTGVLARPLQSGVICRACGEQVEPEKCLMGVAAHQDSIVRMSGAFALYRNDTKCPKCGERGI